MKKRQSNYKKFGHTRYTPITINRVSRIEYPESGIPPRRSTNQHPTASIRMLLCLSLILGAALLARYSAVAAVSDQNREAFRTSLQALTSSEDRSTGTPGSQAAAAYIREFFEGLGFETVGTQKIAVPVIQSEKSTLTLIGRGLTMPIRAMRGNAVMPETIAPPGLRAP